MKTSPSNGNGPIVLRSNKVAPAPPAPEPSGSPNAGNSARRNVWERSPGGSLVNDKTTNSRTTTVLEISEDGMHKHCDNLISWRKIRHVFSSKKFKDFHLEYLYQRYFFRLNQNSLMILMALMATVCVVLIIFYYAEGSTGIAQGVILSLIFVCLVIAEALCSRSWFEHLHLISTCYVMLVFMAVIIAMLTVNATPRTGSEGVWCTIFFLYLIYSLMPIRMRVAVAGGILLSVLHMACALSLNYEDPFLWKQVRGYFTFNKLHVDSVWEPKHIFVFPFISWHCNMECTST